MVIRKQGDWLVAKIGGEVVMMSVQSDHYIGLNKIGARIWELIDSPRTMEDLCDLLVRQFKVSPELCRAEVDSFLRDLEKHGAVAFDSSEAA
jgi:hypothetical protein